MNDYQTLYEKDADPWNYSGRAAEILRHRSVEELLKNTGKRFEHVLDIGCGLGHLTRRLKSVAAHVSACDVSAVAVQKAQNLPQNKGIHFFTAQFPGIPRQAEKFDLVVVADGIHEYVPEPRRGEALSEIERLMKTNGTVLFSDYMRPGKFDPFIRFVGERFKIVKLVYLNDRLWYQFESWFKAVRHWEAVKILLSQIWIAKMLQPLSALLRTYGSTHLVILASKK